MKLQEILEDDMSIRDTLKSIKGKPNGKRKSLRINIKNSRKKGNPFKGTNDIDQFKTDGPNDTSGADALTNFQAGGV